VTREEFRIKVQEMGFEAIGQRLHRARTSKDLTIRDVADRADVSKTTVQRVEQGKPIQLDSLRMIAYGARIKVGDLLNSEFKIGTARSVHRKSEELWFDLHEFSGLTTSTELPDDRNTWAPSTLAFCLMKSRDADGRFNPNLMLVNQPTQTRSHRGEEFVFVVEGRIQVVFEDKAEQLNKGESMFFWAAEHHRYQPVEAGEQALVLSIVLDPFPIAMALENWDKEVRKKRKR
jgi:transcriptional regulator with XRE-family HTH domain